MNSMEPFAWFGPVVFGLFGLCFGSFLNVCISRWPAGMSVVSPRSRCPKCERSISAVENIPVLSWLMLRGKCRGCGLGISVMYPAVELVVGIVWLWSAFRFGPGLTAVRVAGFATFLIGIAITDAKHYIIPDGFTISGIVWVFGSALIAFFVSRDAMGDVPFVGLYNALIGACAGAGAISIIGWLGEASLKKEAMGFGDVTLMAFAGAAVGPGKALLTIFLGATIAAVVFLLIMLPAGKIRSRNRNEIYTAPLVPFGVFLAPAALIALLWGNDLIAWYLHLTGL